ncbi:bacterial Ig-like domain protein [Clostridium puniceum]|uniref:Bacterial Ig-like domain protein n=1 Tax=Clostridium puniceum TaxID=29367 RepID=A0A1S8TVR2_9CLOT|nr:Ig-like domain-containing protein [Clostridium puniceum]OOM81826.1 bacterial Ig-like domain protein [Clostridium puniceum]
MKNYFKKFSIMFVMLLVVIGFGTIQNGIVANAATVGQQLKSPENGWQRFDDTDSRFIYDTGCAYFADSRAYDGGYNMMQMGKTCSFKFYGSKVRVLATYYYTKSTLNNIKIDGVSYVFNSRGEIYGAGDSAICNIVYEKLDLSLGIHTVEITPIEAGGIELDAIDINGDGKLMPYNESITLDKPIMNLMEGDSDQLIASTTPTAVGVKWTISDPSIATIEVDPTNGKIIKVNALKEGTCTITATTIDGSNLSASCTVNVTKKDTPAPENPTDTKTGAILIINLNDGETKVFDVSSSEVAKFKSWYNTKSEYENKLTYEFDKTVNSNISVEEHVVHEKITSFEIRKY